MNELLLPVFDSVIKVRLDGHREVVAFIQPDVLPPFQVRQIDTRRFPWNRWRQDIMKPVTVFDRVRNHLVVKASRVRIISGNHNKLPALPSLGALLPVCSDYLLTRTSFPLASKHLDEQIAGHRAENLVGVAALRRSGIAKSRRVHIEDLDGIPSALSKTYPPILSKTDPAILI